jgi:hypothetical protein
LPLKNGLNPKGSVSLVPNNNIQNWSSHMLYREGGMFGGGVFFSRGGLSGAGNGSIKLATVPEFCEALESAEAWRPRVWPEA